jgi:chemotaxis protein MotB
MKDKPSEWIAISDLMAGVMAVVMLMLVVSVLQKNAAEIAYKEELAKMTGSKNDPVTKIIKTLNTMIQTKSATEFRSSTVTGVSG